MINTHSENLTGFVLKTFAAKESDLVVHVLSTKGVRATMYARGARKETSRKAYAIDLLNLVSVKLDRTKSELPYVNEIRLFSSQRPRLTTLHGLTTIQIVAELMDKFCLEEEEQPFLFILLENLVPYINEQNNVLLIAALALRLLQHAGGLPNLSHDVLNGALILADSQRVLAPEIGYTVRDGGQIISDRIYKVQRFILDNGFIEVLKLNLQPTELMQLLHIHLNWVETFIESPLRTRDIFTKSVTSNRLQVTS